MMIMFSLSLSQSIKTSSCITKKSDTQVFGILHHEELKGKLNHEEVEEISLNLQAALDAYDSAFSPLFNATSSSSPSSSPSTSTSTSCHRHDNSTTTTTSGRRSRSFKEGGVREGARYKDWLLEQCGGTRRGRGCGHDADFLISHPRYCSFQNTEHVLEYIVSCCLLFLFFTHIYIYSICVLYTYKNTIVNICT
jgi:hypothetical protein